LNALPVASIALLMRTILNNYLVFWLLLAIPGVLCLYGWWYGRLDSMDMLHPTGEWSVRFMVIAMCIGPLATIFGSRGWTQWLLRRRRWFGVAAFFYAIAHLLFYIIDMGTLGDMLAELDAPGIWTGWLAMLLMSVPGMLSNDASMRWLKQGWKRAQQFAYPAALFTMLHWGLLEWHWGGALVHISPVIILNILRIIKVKGHFSS
jgi:sulfoxide reductase heme-binding subunit YedZ